MTPDATPLRQRADAATARALARGAQQPVRTHAVPVVDGGLTFSLRVVDSQQRKVDWGRAQPATNPFLPYDPDLFVADLPPAHVCLLNKFNAVPLHLLIVTRAFAEQEAPLSAADFAATWRCLAELGGLAFYNAGTVAGASQRHRHVQWLPAPLVDAPAGAATVERVLGAAVARPGIVRCRELPFAHAAIALDAAGAHCGAAYERLLREIGRGGAAGYSGYNLILTRRWMLAVPRTAERWQGIAINALGFAGTLLLRTADDLGSLRAAGPLAALAAVAG